MSAGFETSSHQPKVFSFGEQVLLFSFGNIILCGWLHSLEAVRTLHKVPSSPLGSKIKIPNQLDLFFEPLSVLDIVTHHNDHNYFFSTTSLMCLSRKFGFVPNNIATITQQSVTRHARDKFDALLCVLS